MIMQSDNSHHEAHQNDLNYSSEYQYDMYMYAEYGIEWCLRAPSENWTHDLFLTKEVLYH